MYPVTCTMLMLISSPIPLNYTYSSRTPLWPMDLPFSPTHTIPASNASILRLHSITIVYRSALISLAENAPLMETSNYIIGSIVRLLMLVIRNVANINMFITVGIYCCSTFAQECNIIDLYKKGYFSQALTLTFLVSVLLIAFLS